MPLEETTTNNVLLPPNSRVIQPIFLEKHSNKKDLIRRLRKVVDVLQNEESIEPGHAEWPGLAATAECIVQQFLHHRDKEVRLHAVLACMELFAIYAPEVPWEEKDILPIFRQTVSQLGNLSHTTDPTAPNFNQYVRILDLLAQVKIGVVLVELAKNEYEDEQGSALECLTELIHTLLNEAVHKDHPTEIFDLVQQSICACIDEYNPDQGLSVPIPFLDELLLCLEQGPTVAALVATEAGQPPKQVEQPNATYQTAAAVVRRMQNKLTSGIAQLLNALLNGDAEKEQSGVSNVHSVVFELHRVAPSINTTVLGTVQAHLSSPDNETRARAVQLLGRIFVRDREARQNYGPLFRAWLARHRDMSVPIRQSILSSSILLLPETAHTVQELLEDPCIDVRLQSIHKLSDAIYTKQLNPPPEALLRAMAKRVSSKHAAERKDAVTGLAKIYFRLFMQPILKDISDDNVDLNKLEDILSVSDHQTLNDCLGWIPTTVFESLCFTDSIDTEMRSRVVQIIDDVLLGSDLSKSKKLSATARAVGLTLILDSIGLHDNEESNALKFLQQFFRQRANLQKAVTQYIDARSEIRQHERGTEPALAAEARALDHLQQVAALSSAPDKVLEAFHGAKDRHIFRILSTIAHPNHSSKSRVRALDELPKRTQSLGDNVAQWVKQLAHRCAMSDFMNQDVITKCVTLALECLRAENVSSCSMFLTTVQLVANLFPALCGGGAFATLSELFSECREGTAKEVRKELMKAGVITRLSSILSVAAAHRPNKKGKTEKATFEELEEQLYRLCTRDGTPEQAKNAVYTLARLESNNSDKFDSIIKTLTSPSRLTLDPGKDESRLLSVLSALSALADCSPSTFDSTVRGEKALAFALEKIVMGRSGDSSSIESDDENAEEDSSVVGNSPASVHTNISRRSSAKKQKETHVSPETNTNNMLDNETLSFACRRICGAINFIVSFFRASILRQPKVSKSFIENRNNMIATVFSMLSQIVRDDGLPPSARDRKLCRLRQDRAALRQYAAVHLLRLCDPRLSLEKQFLSPTKWHVLSEIFLDEEKVVREAAIEELSDLLTGSGLYGLDGSNLPPKAPSLRFLAYITFCIDGDHGLNHSTANANAANVGKASNMVKAAAFQCVTSLRKTSESTFLQCRAMGLAAEQRFENQLKMILMPEYTVPFAFHLLAHRKETPSIDFQEKDDQGEDGVLGIGEQGQHRILRKRLKALIEPLVQSLGDSADNISFLLRLTESIGKHFSPVDVLFEKSDARLSTSSDTSDNVDSNPEASERSRLQLERLRTVAVASREILLSFVKKDVNLSVYPGTILLPKTLFQPRRSVATATALTQQYADPSTKLATLPRIRTPPRSPMFKISTLNETRELTDTPSTFDRSPNGTTPDRQLPRSNLSDGKKTPESNESNKRNRVHFSPEIEASETNKRRKISKFGGISPIPKSTSPASVEPSSASSRHQDKSVATLGSTPPSALRTSTIRSTAVDSETDEESLASSRLLSKTLDGSSKSASISSTIIASEVRRPNNSEQKENSGSTGGKPTSETQSTQTSERSSRQAKSRQTVLRKKAPRKNSIPSLISVSQSKPRKQSKRKKSELDFDSEDDTLSENKQNGQSRKAKVKQGSNVTKYAANNGTRRALRSRMG